MKRTIPGFLIFVVCLSVQCAPSEATIVVDGAHSQMGQPEGADPPAYTIPPCPALLVDTGSYEFPAFGEYTSPNSIQLVLSNEAAFSTEFNPKVALQRLDGKTLTALREKPFTGLADGQTAILAIGYQTSGDNPALKVMWIGLVKVAKAKAN